jgi:ABC-2 type transport system permease protein
MLRDVAHTTKYALRAFARNRRARVFALGMPIGLLILLDALFGSAAHTTVAGVRVSLSDFYLPSVIVVALTTNAFAALVGSVVNQRETGILKRRRATPVEPLALIASQTLTALVTATATTAVLLVIGTIGFGVAVPSGAWPAIVAGVALGAAAFCGLGFALATFVDSVETAQPAIQAVLVPVFFISNIWIPSSSLPGWVNSLASALPVEHVSDVLHRAFAAGALTPGPVLADLGVLAAWAIGGALVATRRFSWLPSTAS